MVTKTPMGNMKTMSYNLDHVEQGAPLSALKNGEYFRKIINGRVGKKVYTKGDYDFGIHKYWCDDMDDISRTVLLKGDTWVKVGFTY